MRASAIWLRRKLTTALSALTTTAAGLAAAIPAVVAYNYLQTRIRGLTGRMEDFGEEFLALIERNFPIKD
ncbi:MAG: MotA/TolQ/ExbB proton channel family protein [Acidobacteria bacterium]|nr:MotA/TolQ/ExbB proton channel family protein [Acidobacteriota bacterium]